jgi:porin
MKPRTLVSLMIFCSRTLVFWSASGFIGTTAWAELLEILRNETAPLSDWLSGDGITGTWGGLRRKLTDRGFELMGSYDAEVWGNTKGGLESGTVLTGLLDFGLKLDLEKAFGWPGASLSTTWLLLSGKNASNELVGNFLTISNNAGFNTLRNYELWFQQNLLDDKISIRLGQVAGDTEFVISDYAALFLNGTFGWPAFMYMNLPEGGPGFPVGTLEMRLAVQPVKWFRFQTAVFQGNVYAQNVNLHGFRWRLDGQNGFFFLDEAQFRWNRSAQETGLPGQFKIGAWFDTAKSAEPNGGGFVRGNYGFYFILDQMLYRKPANMPGHLATDRKDDKSALSGADGDRVTAGEQKSDQGLGWFGRIAFEPQDRNFIGFYFDTGLTYKGLVPSRNADTLGVAFAYAQLSSDAQQAEIDEGSVGVGAEMALEVTYQAQITKWLSIQPDLQVIINPGGNQDLNNALVIGGRVSITF